MQSIFFFFGLCIGSFLNVLADRLPKEENVLWDRSRCDYCKKSLRWHELIPIVSFIAQRGRCLRCHKKLSLQYPLVELVTGIGFALLHAHPTSLIIFCAFLVILIADLKFQIIPDSMVLALAIGVVLRTGLVVPNLVTGVLSALFFYCIWLSTRGKGMGFGDVKLAGVLGLLLGFPMTVFALYIAFLTGATVGVILIIGKRKTLKSKIAFGPFLIFGAVGTILFHQQLLVLWNTIL